MQASLCSPSWTKQSKTLVDLNPARGHEQAGRRPGLVVSVDPFNHGPAGLVVVLPVTTKEKGIPFHVEIDAKESGLKHKSFVKCEDVRSVSKVRLAARLGMAPPRVMEEVEDRLRILLGL